MSQDFAEAARECAGVLRRVLAGEIKNRRELESAWPAMAVPYTLLDEVMNDVFEFWVLEPGVRYGDVLKATIEVLENASNNPEETARRLEEVLDET